MAPLQAAAVVLATLIACTVPYATAEFVHVRVMNGPSNILGNHGCMPAEFSSHPDPATLSSNITLIKAVPAEACVTGALLDNAASIAGKALLVDRGSCTFATKWEAARAAGAVALIVANNNPMEIPFEMAAPGFTPADADIPACITWNAAGAAMSSALAAGSTVEVHFAGFAKYDENNEQLPAHPVTWLSVLSPELLAGEYPVSQATYNPNTLPKRSGDVVFAEFESKCAAPYEDADTCRECWEDDLIFSNRGDMQGKVVVFRLNTRRRTPACFSSFHELTWHAQRAGAVGAVYAIRASKLYTLAPYLVPYQLTVGMFATFDYLITHWDRTVNGDSSGQQLDVEVQLPALSDGSGADYALTENDEGALPFTKLQISVGAGIWHTADAGQAMFNPDTNPAVTARGVYVEFAPECALAGDTDTLGAFGVDCTTCVDKLNNGGLVTTPSGQLTSQVAFVNSSDVFCIEEWSHVTTVLAQAGAAAMVIGNARERIYSLPRRKDESIQTIPTFNVFESEAAFLIPFLRDIVANVQFSLPELKDGKAVETSSGGSGSSGGIGSGSGSGEEGPPYELVSVQITKPTALATSLSAGQSKFNPAEMEPVEGLAMVGILRADCTTASGDNQCHGCEYDNNLFSSQVVNSITHPRRGTSSNVILVVNASHAGCIYPLWNYVLAAQDISSKVKGVVFINKDEQTYVLGPDAPDGLITIPTYNVAQATGAKLIRMLSFTDYQLFIKLPAIHEGRAVPTPESIEGTISGQSNTAHGDKTGKGDEKGVNIVPIIIGCVAGAVVLGACVSLGVQRWRRRRLYAYNTVTSGQQTDFEDGDRPAAFTAIGLNGAVASAPPARAGGKASGMLGSLRSSISGRGASGGARPRGLAPLGAAASPVQPPPHMRPYGPGTVDTRRHTHAGVGSGLGVGKSGRGDLLLGRGARAASTSSAAGARAAAPGAGSSTASSSTGTGMDMEGGYELAPRRPSGATSVASSVTAAPDGATSKR